MCYKSEGNFARGVYNPKCIATSLSSMYYSIPTTLSQAQRSVQRSTRHIWSRDQGKYVMCSNLLHNFYGWCPYINKYFCIVELSDIYLCTISNCQNLPFFCWTGTCHCQYISQTIRCELDNLFDLMSWYLIINFSPSSVPLIYYSFITH